jgi:hypothetical protein
MHGRPPAAAARLAGRSIALLLLLAACLPSVCVLISFIG